MLTAKFLFEIKKPNWMANFRVIWPISCAWVGVVESLSQAPWWPPHVKNKDNFISHQRVAHLIDHLYRKHSCLLVIKSNQLTNIFIVGDLFNFAFLVGQAYLLRKSFPTTKINHFFGLVAKIWLYIFYRVGLMGVGVQCKLVPGACVSVLLAVHFSLRSRLSGTTDDLCEEKITNKV